MALTSRTFPYHSDGHSIKHRKRKRRNQKMYAQRNNSGAFAPFLSTDFKSVNDSVRRSLKKIVKQAGRTG
jgi:hypothetical protein